MILIRPENEEKCIENTINSYKQFVKEQKDKQEKAKLAREEKARLKELESKRKKEDKEKKLLEKLQSKYGKS